MGERFRWTCDIVATVAGFLCICFRYCKPAPHTRRKQQETKGPIITYSGSLGGSSGGLRIPAQPCARCPGTSGGRGDPRRGKPQSPTRNHTDSLDTKSHRFLWHDVTPIPPTQNHTTLDDTRLHGLLSPLQLLLKLPRPRLLLLLLCSSNRHSNNSSSSINSSNSSSSSSN